MTLMIKNEKQNKETTNSIMNDIEKKYSKKECKDIGKTWKRNCPKCGVELIYTNKRSFYQICKNNSLCGSCCQLGKGHPHTVSHKEYMKSLMTGRKVTWNDKIKNNHWSKDPKLRKEISEKHSELMTDLFSNGTYNNKNKSFKCGYFLNKTTGNNEFYRSSYELRKMNELNGSNDIKVWTTAHKIKIPYYINGIRHFYLPDFLIEMNDGSKILEEVKGFIENIEVFKLKIKYAKKYCKENNIRYKISYDKDIAN